MKTKAWPYATIAIIAAVGVLLASGTTVAAQNSIRKAGKTAVAVTNAPKVTEEMWNVDREGLMALPPVLILRPTHFSSDIPGSIRNGTKYVCWNVACGFIFDLAYPDIFGPRCIRLVSLPAGAYDLADLTLPRLTNGVDMMLTLTNHPFEALQKEIAKQYGFMGRREMLETNVLRLKLVKAGAPGLKPGQGPSAPINSSKRALVSSGYSIRNTQSLGDLIDMLENMRHIPIVDETRLKDFYDVTLTWKYQPSASPEPWLETARKLMEPALRDQLGLELVPGRAQVEMLVVDKVK